MAPRASPARSRGTSGAGAAPPRRPATGRGRTSANPAPGLRPVRRRGDSRKDINLALQGGGSHGAFTWGVLDALLADGRIAIEGVSGTSAGAMNAVVLADGYERGGPDEARAQLERFWYGVSRNGAAFGGLPDVFDGLASFWKVPGFDFYGFVSQWSTLVSPYRTNPFNINPLRHLLERLVDFDRVQSCRTIRLFIAATNVRTGKGRVFTDGEVTAKAVLASTTLPQLFQAVEIDGEHYWDGGFTGNPPLWPFYTFTAANDILLVQINPVRRERLPLTAQEIMDRVDEVTFNSSLLKELRAIDFVNRMLDEGRLDRERYRANRMHRIDATRALDGAGSKLDTGWEFLTRLKRAGEEAGRAWLDANFDAIGVRATLDLRAEFM